MQLQDNKISFSDPLALRQVQTLISFFGCHTVKIERESYRGRHGAPPLPCLSAGRGKGGDGGDPVGGRAGGHGLPEEEPRGGQARAPGDGGRSGSGGDSVGGALRRLNQLMNR